MELSSGETSVRSLVPESDEPVHRQPQACDETSEARIAPDRIELRIAEPEACQQPIACGALEFDERSVEIAEGDEDDVAVVEAGRRFQRRRVITLDRREPGAKAEDGPDLVIQGSSTIYPQLLTRGLLDRLVLMIAPITLGAGKRLFGDGVPAGAFKLIEHRLTPGGWAIATYEPAGPVKTGSSPRRSRARRSADVGQGRKRATGDATAVRPLPFGRHLKR